MLGGGARAGRRARSSPSLDTPTVMKGTTVYLLMFRSEGDWYLGGSSTSLKDTEDWLFNAVGKTPFLNDKACRPLGRDDVKACVMTYEGTDLRHQHNADGLACAFKVRTDGGLDHGGGPRLSWADEPMDPMLRSMGRVE